MKLGIYAAVITAFAIAASPALKAQDMPEAQDMPNPGKPCKSDREKFCPGLKPGDGKLGPCMKEHAAELSPECTAAAEAGKQARKAIRANCKADIAKFCADTPKERGAIGKCLESHASELESACGDAVKSRPGAKKA
jgi:hypothetical protein